MPLLHTGTGFSSFVVVVVVSEKEHNKTYAQMLRSKSEINNVSSCFMFYLSHTIQDSICLGGLLQK